ncbi:MAG: RNA methyltransferase [Dysgonamonadaceae bacterium]|jgi:TrmH family RNA methyltransferase|nr:RNA methyltransferase [Dysgonamonadaceae bacterium]
MLSKSKIKYIRSLGMKKFRNETGCFLAEGNKLVKDILPYFECELLVAKPSWMAGQGDLHAGELIAAEDHDIEKASLLKTPQDVIAVFKQPNYPLDKEALKLDLNLVLDGVQDPGNMGTIVRLADWFGIKNVICSPDTADIFNPKTVQATMGAIARVKVFYTELPVLLADLNDIPVYGAFLEGKNIYEEPLSANGLIVMGNEGKGVSRPVAGCISRKLYIPNYPAGTATTESLNVAVATAIICSEFRRRQYSPDGSSCVR